MEFENIIEFDDQIIGKGKDAANYMIENLKKVIDQTDDVDEGLVILQNYYEALKSLKMYKNSLVSVKECPMSGFTVKELEVN